MTPFHWPEFLFGLAVGVGITLVLIAASCVLAYRSSERTKARLLAKVAGSLGNAVRDAAHPNDPKNN